MIALPLTEEIKYVFTYLINDTVLKNVVEDYAIDENFLYIPKNRFKSAKILNKLMCTGKIKKPTFS
jgi:hypothetical protein